MDLLKNKTENVVTKATQKLCIATLLFIMMISCSSDDGVDSPIQAKKQTFTITNLNGCTTPGGSGSVLNLSVPYAAPSGVTINKLHIKSKASDGTGDDAISTSFTNTNGVISYGTCFRFNANTWIEITVTLEASDGTLSNPSKVKINKPNGAN